MSISTLFVLLLPHHYLIIIDQSDCFGITLLIFAVIRSCHRFEAQSIWGRFTHVVMREASHYHYHHHYYYYYYPHHCHRHRKRADL